MNPRIALATGAGPEARRLPPPRAATLPPPGPDRDRDFATAQLALRGSGGLISADALAGVMLCGASQPISRLARWIVARQVLNVQWHGQTLLPLFQFGDDRVSLRPGLAPVLAELGDVFDEWELLLWFAAPNSELRGAQPADLLARRPLDVWRAARTDRFVATGS